MTNEKRADMTPVDARKVRESLEQRLDALDREVRRRALAIEADVRRRRRQASA